MTNNSQISETVKLSSELEVAELTTESGRSGTALVYWYLNEEYNSKMRGKSAIKTYDEMRRTDAQVNASLLSMELPLRSTRRYIEPAFDVDWEISDADKEVADFIEKCLFERQDQARDDLLRSILTMLPFWFSVFEKVFDIKDGKIILKKIAYRKQLTIEKRETQDGEPGVTQSLVYWKPSGENAWDHLISIPAEKLLVFTHRREGDNYEGISVLRSAYKHRYIKDNIYRFSAIRHERQGVWIPKIHLPKNATADDKVAAEKIVRSLRATERTGVIVPGSKDDGREIEFMDMKSSQTTWFGDDIEHHNREIVKNILAQFLELWNTASGSRSLGESQTEYFLMSLESVWKYVCDVFNKYLIKQLVDLNFTVENYPKLCFDPLSWRNNENLVDMVTKLTGAWIIIADDNMDDYMRDVLELPSRDVDSQRENVEKKEEFAECGCWKDHTKWYYFDNKYFNELSWKINNDFIKKTQNAS